MERRLAAILAADVVGFSRLMEADEEATARTLSTYREIMEGLVASHHGRVFGSAGDSIVAEFASPVEAVRCAVAIQRELEAQNVDLPEDRRMRLRIGVNLGDVMVEGDNLLGDGVNIAARLEALAEPGGISLARSVFDQVKKRLDLGYEYLGEHEVKNISEPVPVYRVLTGPEATGKVIGETKRVTQSWKRMALTAAVAVLIGVAGAVTWLRPWEPIVEPASVERMAFPLPDKPSIAVLPFTNLSDDPSQEYFAGGMTEDLITDLSKVSGLFVIARNSTLSYREKSPDFRQIGKALGVPYVIVGSVRKAGETIRINVQLIEAATGRHIWAERYDRELEDVFAIQDDVTGRIVSALSVELTPDEKELIARKGTGNLEAFDLYMRGREQEGFFNKEANLAARNFYQRTIALDPNYAEAYAHLSQIHSLDAQFGWTENVEGAYTKSLELAQKAVKLNKDLPFAHFALGRTLSRPVFARYDRAIEEMDRVIALDPNYADGYAFLSLLYVYTGDAGRALGVIEKAMRINPIFPFWYYYALGMAQYTLTNYRAAVENLTMAAKRNPTVFFVRYALAAALAKAGRQDDAEWQLDELHAMGFDMTLREVMAQNPIQDPATRDSYFEGLREAGFE